MGKRDELRAALRALDRSRWPDYLTRHSGLPGPRANLELCQAVADEADAATIDALLATGDEYLTLCAVVGLPGDRLRPHAADTRWRVREGVAMALQRLADTDWTRCTRLADTFAGDPDPLVQRAAVAGICEPRLLRSPDAAAYAVDLCARVTASLAARPDGERRSAGVRSLRQALGYCWSVAVAADPGPGLARFRELERSTDPDVRWIVRENRKKTRLAKLT